MHKKFVAKWCRTYDTMYDSIGEEAAIKLLVGILGPANWGLVIEQLPEYFRAKREQEWSNGRQP